MKLTERTFEEWSRLGYKIKRGSKATWVEGKALFNNKQVVLNSYHSYVTDSDYEREMDEFYGTDYFH